MTGKVEATLETPDAAPIECGIIMPISASGDYTETHWRQILELIEGAVRDAGMVPKLVSISDAISTIHKTIVQNISNLPIVVCDVSSRNANVMFELGMRVAFDKAVVLIKDDATPYSFDTSLIEHLPYRRDMRYFETIEFRAKLASKIKHTLEAATKDPSYSTFLKQFGTFKTATLDEQKVSGEEFLLSELREVKYILGTLARSPFSDQRSIRGINNNFRDFSIVLDRKLSDAERAKSVDTLQDLALEYFGIMQFDGDDRVNLSIPNVTTEEYKTTIAKRILSTKGAEKVSVSR